MARRLVKMTPVIQLQTNKNNYSYFQKDTQILLENNLDRTLLLGVTSKLRPAKDPVHGALPKAALQTRDT